jgi:hypothetical protein
MGRALSGALLLALCFVGPAQAQNTPSDCVPAHFLSAATSGGQIVQAAVGKHALCSFIAVTNFGATTSGDVRFYDTNNMTAALCSAPASLVKLNIPVPTNATAANVAGIVIPLPADLQFYQGIGICYTGAVTDIDTTTPATSAQVNYGVR